jgi:ribosomal protein S18 acetylase RimI-like enzyme
MSTLHRARSAEIETATTGDVPFTALLHRSELPHGFFVGLGMRFLRAYHRTFVDSPHGVALTAWVGGRPVGFLVGTTANPEHYRWVLRHRGPHLALLAIIALVGRPTLALQFLRTRSLRYARFLSRTLRRRAGQLRGSRREAAAHPAPPTAVAPTVVAVLTHFAVCPSARGAGAGRALVGAFVGAARAAGAEEGQLVTEPTASGTHAFYRRLGWRHVGDRRSTGGHLVSRFTRSLR